MNTFQKGEIVLLETDIKRYDGLKGPIWDILLPPPWIAEDNWGYEFWVDLGAALGMACQLIVPFYKHEVRRIETKEEL